MISAFHLFLPSAGVLFRQLCWICCTRFWRMLWCGRRFPNQDRIKSTFRSSCNISWLIITNSQCRHRYRASLPTTRCKQKPVSIHKNKHKMFCPAHIQVASCLAVPKVLKSLRGVDDTHVRFCIRLIWELDSQSGIVCHLNKITTNLQWSLCVVGCFYVSCCSLPHHRFHWFRKSYLVVFHSIAR